MSKPEIGTQEWQDYLLGKMESSELVDGAPRTMGLYRVIEREYGVIRDSVNVVKAPSQEDISATVICDVQVSGQDKNGNLYIRKASGAADVSPVNTEDPYCRHPVATASTRALGIALKKVMGLNLHVAEEFEGNKKEPTYPMASPATIKSIKNMMAKLKVSEEDFLAKFGVSAEQIKPDALTKELSMEILGELNDIRNG